jgi:hypothetical protein
MQAALQATDVRMQAIEARISDLRATAKKQMQSGQKAQALRSLKLAKAFERKLVSLGDLSAALEHQRDQLEEVGLQQSIAAALGAGVSDMMKAQKTVKRVEQVVDQANDLNDVSADLTSALENFSSAAFVDCDEDALMAELLEMQTEPEPASVPSLHTSISSIVKQMPVAPTALPEQLRDPSLRYGTRGLGSAA